MQHRRFGEDSRGVEEGTGATTTSTKQGARGSAGRWWGGGGRLLLGGAVVLGYAGLIYSLTLAYGGTGGGDKAASARQLQASALTELEQSLGQIEKEAKALAAELDRKKQEVDDLKKELKQRDEVLSKQERKIKMYDKVQERISEDALVKKIQKQESIFNHLRWGEGPARILMATEKGDIEIETAPFDLMPHSIHWFLTLVETGFWNGCHVIRNAGHVIQLNCNGRKPPHPRQPSIVFQEYSPEFNHNPYTLGIAGRPGGPDFYFNLVDNIRSHGPGGQGPEADPCFAKVVKGKDVIQSLHKSLGNEFLDKAEWVKLNEVKILPQPSP